MGERKIGKENQSYTHNSLQPEDHEVKNGQVFFQVNIPQTTIW